LKAELEAYMTIGWALVDSRLALLGRRKAELEGFATAWSLQPSCHLKVGGKIAFI
jgi:hypothetical protein